MSAHTACTCPGTRVERMKKWVVLTRNSRTSAFDGYHEMWSPYSLVRCLGPGEYGDECSGMWRSKGDYVDSLPDGRPRR